MDKAKRYDRGIRVWGAHGQAALEAARVCLLNAGPTGTEVLKNLVLGGIHSFTIVDGAKVEAADLGNNFLLTADALGSSRAQCATGAPPPPPPAWAGQGLGAGPCCMRCGGHGGWRRLVRCLPSLQACRRQRPGWASVHRCCVHPTPPCTHLCQPLSSAYNTPPPPSPTSLMPTAAAAPSLAQQSASKS